MSKQEKPALLEAQRAIGGQLGGKSRARRAVLSQLPAIPSVRRNDLLPPLELVLRPLSQLRAPPRAVRVIEPSHVRDIAGSIAQLGFSSPVIIDGDDQIIHGVASVEAARLLGLDHVPCVRVSHLSATERRVLRLALNRLSEKGKWDLDELKSELAELVIVDAPLDITGFSFDEIDHILLDTDADALEPGDLDPSDDRPAVARIGDCFLLGPHRVVCGDATDERVIRDAMGGGAEARLVMTDEPYNVPIAGHVTSGPHREFPMASGEMTGDQFFTFNLSWMAHAAACLCDGGVLGTFIDWRGYPTVATAAARLDLQPLNLVVWGKTNAGMGSLYRSQHELLPLFKKGKAPHVNNVRLGAKGRSRSNLWTYPGASSRGSDARRGLKDHPTVKPVAMIEDALLDLTNRGDVVLDPFLGSGSTLLAAQRTGRICRGIELDPRYVDVVLRRYRDVTGDDTTLAETGESFADLARRRNDVPG